MSLDSCPTCGSALSIISRECRQCAAAAAKASWIKPFQGENGAYYGLGLIFLIVVFYLFFHFR